MRPVAACMHGWTGGGAGSLRPTICYEILCGVHRCSVSSTDGYECIHTIPYTCCVPWAAFSSTIQRVRTSSNEISANCRTIRNSRFGAIRNSARLWHGIWLCSSFKPMGGYGHALSHIGIGFGGLGELQGPSGGCLDAGQCRKRGEMLPLLKVCPLFGRRIPVRE